MENVNLNLVTRNLTCLFGTFDRNKVKVDPLRELVPGEVPKGGISQDPSSVWVFNYARAGLQVFLMERHLAIIAGGPSDSEVSRDFIPLCGQVLRACGENVMSAFGFNFDFEVDTGDAGESLAVAAGLPDRLLRPLGHVLATGVTFRLVYRDEGVLYTVELQDGTAPTVHLNVHFAGDMKVEDLAGAVADRYSESLEKGTRLIGAVLGGGSSGGTSGQQADGRQALGQRTDGTQSDGPAFTRQG